MNKLEQKIIDKFWENVIEVSPDGIKSDTIKVVSDDNVFDLIHQVREETIKEIIKLLKEYLDLNTDDMLGTVDYETFGIRVSELLQSLLKQLLVKNKI